jgi:hypothetical protein
VSRDAKADELATDTVIRTAFHAAGLPAVTANAIAAAMEQTIMKLGEADEPQLQTFAANEGLSLRGLWGENFEAKIAAVDTFLEQTAAKVPFVAAWLSNPKTQLMLADRRLVVALSQMLEGRHST